nr:immunoglobulin heavy chain junction region [Mus musculus]MBK4183804.1 immunoglobulin heavy chain junction region [Mus musculus]MBK4189986.1 immunoglobulin heavy chain junction region [Mus musculus]
CARSPDGYYAMDYW